MKKGFSFAKILISSLLICVSAYCSQAFAGNPKNSSDKCIIKSGGKTYKPSGCIIVKNTDGELDWYIIKRKNEKPLIRGVSLISITEMTPGTAEVFGLTTKGINSRWGEATRDGNCWLGSDFTICLEKSRK